MSLKKCVFISAWCLLIFYVAVYILAMTPSECFLLTKNGSSILQQLALITFLLLYIYIKVLNANYFQQNDLYNYR